MLGSLGCVKVRNIADFRRFVARPASKLGRLATRQNGERTFGLPKGTAVCLTPVQGVQESALTEGHFAWPGVRFLPKFHVKYEKIIEKSRCMGQNSMSIRSGVSLYSVWLSVDLLWHRAAALAVVITKQCNEIRPKSTVKIRNITFICEKAIYTYASGQREMFGRYWVETHNF